MLELITEHALTAYNFALMVTELHMGSDDWKRVAVCPAAHDQQLTDAHLMLQDNVLVQEANAVPLMWLQLASHRAGHHHLHDRHSHHQTSLPAGYQQRSCFRNCHDRICSLVPRSSVFKLIHS